MLFHDSYELASSAFLHRFLHRVGQAVRIFDPTPKSPHMLEMAPNGVSIDGEMWNRVLHTRHCRYMRGAFQKSLLLWLG